MPLDKGTFAQNMDNMRTLLLAYIASIRQPSDKAEDLLAAAKAWLESQSTEEYQLVVKEAGASIVNDVFVFVVEQEWLDGSGTGMASLQVARAEMEAA